MLPFKKKPPPLPFFPFSHEGPKLPFQRDQQIVPKGFPLILKTMKQSGNFGIKMTKKITQIIGINSGTLFKQRIYQYGGTFGQFIQLIPCFFILAYEFG